MKSTFSRMAAVALTMWLGFAAGTANAVTYITPWAGSATAGYSTLFGNSDTSSSFTDIYTFSLPIDASGSGGSNVISLGGGNVFFTAFTLADATLGTVIGTIDNLASSGPSALLTFFGGGVPGSYTLTVGGYKNNTSLTGSYGGNINISPVPEPETYAMLLAGLGLVGFSARRRMNNGSMNNA